MCRNILHMCKPSAVRSAHYFHYLLRIIDVRYGCIIKCILKEFDRIAKRDVIVRGGGEEFDLYFIFYIFYLTTKHEILQISNHNLLCSLDPPNQGRLF